jgi:hypothetical protein
VTLRATGLLANEPVQIFLGEQMVDVAGSTDSAGAFEAILEIPTEEDRLGVHEDEIFRDEIAAGRRLITVRTPKELRSPHIAF